MTHSPDSAPRLWWLHVAGLWTFVVAQPLLDVIARNPDFLIAYRAGRAEVLGLTVALVLVCPALVALGVALIGAGSRRLGRLAVDACVAVLVATFAMQLGRRFGAHASAAGPLACLAGVAAAVAYHRRSPVRSIATALSASVVVVPLLFLFRPAVRHVLLEGTPRSSAVAGLPARAEPVPVVLFVFDELGLVPLLDGEGRLDAALYPHFANLARDGVWFRNATTVSDYTRWALPAILTGRRPTPSLAPSARDYPESLFTLLSRTHAVHALESVTALCPDDVCGGEAPTLRASARQFASDLAILYQHIALTEDLTAHLPDPAEAVAGFGSNLRSPAQGRRDHSTTPTIESRMALVDAFLADIARPEPGRPGLFLLHSMLSHSPSWLLPSGQIDGTRANEAALRLPVALPNRKPGLWPNDEWAVTQAYQRYLLQVGFVDTLLGRLVDRMKQAGIYDRSLFIVLSDHGTAFRPRMPRRHFTDATAAEIMRIPLFVKLPAGSPRRIRGTVAIDGLNVNDRNVETIDLVPTIAGVLGVRMPWHVDGVSLVDEGARDRGEKVVFHDSARRRQGYGAAGPDVLPAVRLTREAFGGAENPYRVPRPPSFAGLVGRTPEDVGVAGSGCAVRIDYLSDFSRMKRDAPVVPFEMHGTFDGSRPRESLTPVAVAVNGTIRAVTRTWRAAPAEWLATPPLDAWREGANRVDVFTIEGGAERPALRRCAVREGLAR